MNTALSALTAIRREYPAWVAWPISVGLVFFLCSISSPIFDTNDDTHLSMIAHGYGIATVGSPRLVYSNVLWGYFIRLVPEVWGVPGYSLITLGIVVVVGAVVTWSLLATGIGIAAAIAVLTLIVGRALLIPQYTINAGLLMVAAVLCWHRFDTQTSSGRLALCAGCLLAYCSFLVRTEGFLLVLGVSLPLMPWRSLWLRRDAKVALVLLAVAIGASSLLDHFAYRGAEWAEFERFNAVRGPYNDYGAAGHLEQKPQVLRRYGYTANDVDLIADWFFEDPKIADPDKLQSMLRELGPLAFQPGSLEKGLARRLGAMDFRHAAPDPIGRIISRGDASALAHVRGMDPVSRGPDHARPHGAPRYDACLYPACRTTVARAVSGRWPKVSG